MDISTSVVYVFPSVRESDFHTVKVLGLKLHDLKLHCGAASEEAGPVR
jgi:hypothetical protein